MAMPHKIGRKNSGSVDVFLQSLQETLDRQTREESVKAGRPWWRPLLDALSSKKRPFVIRCKPEEEQAIIEALKQCDGPNESKVFIIVDDDCHCSLSP